MVISLKTPLPCSQPAGSLSKHEGQSHCGQPTTIGLITLAHDDTWYLQPLCRRHAEEAAITRAEILACAEHAV